MKATRLNQDRRAGDASIVRCHFRRLAVLGGAVAAVMGATHAFAQNVQYWDPNGVKATGGSYNSGTWDTSTADWTNGTTNTTDTAFNSGNIAFFGGGTTSSSSASVNLGGSVTAAGLVLATGNDSTFGSSNGLSIVVAGVLNITGAITNDPLEQDGITVSGRGSSLETSNGLIYNGTGWLAVNAPTFNTGGSIAVDEGTLSLNSATSVTNANTIVIGSTGGTVTGSALQTSTSTALASATSITINNGSSLGIRFSGNNTFNTTLTIGGMGQVGTMYDSYNANQSYLGAIDSANFVSGTSTFTGAVTLTSSTQLSAVSVGGSNNPALAFTNNVGLAAGVTSANLNLEAGNQSTYAGAGGSIGLITIGNLASPGSTTVNLGSGIITKLGGAIGIFSSHNTDGFGLGVAEIAGQIQTAGGVVVDGGMLRLDASNTFTGNTTVYGGAIVARGTQAFGATANTVTLNNGALYMGNLNGDSGITIPNNVIINGVGSSDTQGAIENNDASSTNLSVITYNPSNTLSGNVTLNTSSRFSSDIGQLMMTGSVTGTNTNLELSGVNGYGWAGNSAPNTISGSIALGSGSLIKDGDGNYWAVTNTGNNFSGGVLVATGTLITGGAGSLGSVGNNNSIRINAGANLVLGASGTAKTTPVLNSSGAALAGIGVSYNGVPAINDATGNGGVFGVNTTGFTALTSMTSLPNTGWYMGSQIAGTYSGSSLAAAPDNNYRLGGGGGTLTVTNGVLTGGGNSLLVGSPLANGNGTVVLQAANNFGGATTITGGGTNPNSFSPGNGGAGSTSVTEGTTFFNGIGGYGRIGPTSLGFAPSYTTLVLGGTTGALTSTSGITIDSYGTLQIGDGANAPAANPVGTSAITLAGGQLLLQGETGTATTSSVAAVNIGSSGDSIVTVNLNGASSGALNIAGIARSAGGGTVNFIVPASTSISLGSAVAGGNSVISGAFLNGTDMLANAAGLVGAAAYSVQDDPGSWSNANISSDASGFSGTTSASTINSLRFSGNTTGASNVTLGAALSITSGNILVSSTNSGAASINGSTLTSGNGHDLIVDDNGGSLSITSQITGTGVGLTKSGSGTLILNNSSNNFTGPMVINGGLVYSTASFAAGWGSSSSVILNGGGLEFNAVDSSPNGNIYIGNGGGIFDVVGSAEPFTTPIANVPGQVGALTFIHGTLDRHGPPRYAQALTFPVQWAESERRCRSLKDRI